MQPVKPKCGWHYLSKVEVLRVGNILFDRADIIDTFDTPKDVKVSILYFDDRMVQP